MIDGATSRDDGALRALWDSARRAVDRTEVQRAEGLTLPVSRHLDPARLERERALRHAAAASPESAGAGARRPLALLAQEGFMDRGAPQ